jgi:hypothetical protein
MKHLSAAIICLLFIAVSCRQPSGKAGTDAILIEFRQNLSGADSSWHVMMNSDDGKIQNMERLTAELLLLDACDSSSLMKIKTAISGLKEMRYNRQNLREPGRIDQYDSACTALITALKQEVSRNPKAEQFQIVNQLVNEVSVADDSVLFYRKEYDRFADKLNISLKENRKKLQSEIRQPDSLKPFPVFRLVP